MSESTVSTDELGMSDEDLFRAANEPDQAPVEAEAPVEQEPQTQERKRDEHGRFAKREEEEAPEEAEPEAEAQEDAKADPTNGLSRRLKEEADKRRAVEQEREFWRQQALQAAQQRQAPQQPQQQEQIDPVAQMLADPEGYIQQRMFAQTEQMSRRFAEVQHGPEKVSEAYSALQQAINSGQINGQAVVSDLQKSNDPFAMIMSWHERNLDAQDPTRALARQLESMPEDQRAAFLSKFAPQSPAPAQPTGRTAIVTPKSLTRATNVASDAVTDNMMPDDRGLWDFANRR